MHTVYMVLMSVGEYWQRVNFVKTDFKEGLVNGLLDSKESLTCVTDSRGTGSKSNSCKRNFPWLKQSRLICSLRKVFK